MLVYTSGRNKKSNFIFTARERSVREGNVFKFVFLSIMGVPPIPSGGTCLEYHPLQTGPGQDQGLIRYVAGTTSLARGLSCLQLQSKFLHEELEARVHV